jgi:hypothetical protein
MATAEQLEDGEATNIHGLPGPGQDFNGEQDVNYEAVAPARHPPHGEPGHPGSGWSFIFYKD